MTQIKPGGQSPKHRAGPMTSPQPSFSQKQPGPPGTHASLRPQVPLHSGASVSPQACGPLIVVVVVELDVVVVESQGQFGKSGGGLPTATFRQISASVDVTGGTPLRLQMHSGVHVVTLTAAFKINRQSVATGPGPSDTGCPQSPRAAAQCEYKPRVPTNAAARMNER
jgi:hypothetical protein